MHIRIRERRKKMGFLENTLAVWPESINGAYDKAAELLDSLGLGDEEERLVNISEELVKASVLRWDDPTGYIIDCIFSACREVIQDTFPGMKVTFTVDGDASSISADGSSREALEALLETKFGGVIGDAVSEFVNSGAADKWPCAFGTLADIISDQDCAEDARSILMDISEGIRNGNGFVTYRSLSELGEEAVNDCERPEAFARMSRMKDECGVDADDWEYGQWMVDQYECGYLKTAYLKVPGSGEVVSIKMDKKEEAV